MIQEEVTLTILHYLPAIYLLLDESGLSRKKILFNREESILIITRENMTLSTWM